MHGGVLFVHLEKAPELIKRIIEVSSTAAHLTTRHRQLVLQRDGETIASAPIEDLGAVIVDHPGTTYSHAAISGLLEAQTVLIVCGRNHLPLGLLLPLSEHTEVGSRLRCQIAASLPLKKRLWKQLVQAKIQAQAQNLRPDSAEQRKLLQFASEVKSGDSTNREAQAAKVYWSAWLTATDETNGETAFRRQREGDSPNSLLNYGYAILRACIARALVSAGLVPALGLQHSNRSNSFSLADDLIEPLRPLVDETVRDLYWSGQTELDRTTKAALLELTTVEVSVGDLSGPLMVSLHRYVGSLVRCLQGHSKRLEIPVTCRSRATAVCGS